MKFLFLMIFSVFIGSVSHGGGNERVPNFSSSKKIFKKFPELYGETLYCGCKIKNQKFVDMESCGYVPPSKSVRAGKIEIEHVVPASALSEGIAYNKSLCGKKSKRSCLEDTNPEYARRTADLYNLFPEDGLVNLIRSDKPMEEVMFSEKNFGKCDIKSDKRGFTPRKEAKGVVARVYLYMDQAYPAARVVSNKNRKLYEAWSKMFPVSKSECQRVKLIEKLQQNENSIVKEPCIKAKLW